MHGDRSAPEGRQERAGEVGALDGRSIGGPLGFALAVQRERDRMGAVRVRQGDERAIEVVAVLVMVGVVVVLVQQGHAVPRPGPAWENGLG